MCWRAMQKKLARSLQELALVDQVPCITLRDETGWVEAVHSGWNQPLGADLDRMLSGFSQTGKLTVANGRPYGKGQAAQEISIRLRAP